MFDAKQKLDEIKSLSANVTEYVDSELYRLEADKDHEWNDFEIITYCIPMLVEELQELGVYVDLDETDYLSEWIYSEGIINLRKLLDKENIPIILNTNQEYLNFIKNIFENIASDDRDLIKDLLELMTDKQIGDIYVLDQVNYVSNYLYSDAVFRDYMNYLIGQMYNKSSIFDIISSNKANIDNFKYLASNLLEIVVPIRNEVVTEILNTTEIQVSQDILIKMEKEYLEEFLNSSYTDKYVFIYNNSPETTSDLNYAELTKDIRVRLNNVYRGSLTYCLGNYRKYTLLLTTVHLGTMYKLEKLLNSDVDPNTYTKLESCYRLLKLTLKYNTPEQDIRFLLPQILFPKNYNATFYINCSKYLEALIGFTR